MRLPGITMLLFIAVLSLNCNKKDSTPTDISPIFNIIDPIPNATYQNGDNLRTQGDMTDNNGLTTAKVEIRNKTTGAIIFQQSTPTGNETFFRFNWNYPVTGITVDFIATVRVICVDKLGNQVFSEIDVRMIF